MGLDLASFLLGILVTILCAFIPYNRSTKQLAKEADRLAKISTLLSRALEESGVGKFNRNEKGEPIGLRFSEVVCDEVKCSDEAFDDNQPSDSFFKTTR